MNYFSLKKKNNGHVKERKRTIPMHVWIVIVHTASYSAAKITKQKHRYLHFEILASYLTHFNIMPRVNL